MQRYIMGEVVEGIAVGQLPDFRHFIKCIPDTLYPFSKHLVSALYQRTLQRKVPLSCFQATTVLDEASLTQDSLVEHHAEKN
jgi:hypothetical protein